MHLSKLFVLGFGDSYEWGEEEEEWNILIYKFHMEIKQILKL